MSNSLKIAEGGWFPLIVGTIIATLMLSLTLVNCNKLGFDADLDHKNYYLAHETIVRCDSGSAIDPVSFGVFSFLNRIASRAPDFFKIPHDAVIEVGFRVDV